MTKLVTVFFVLPLYFISFVSSAQITEISDQPLDVAVYLINKNNPKYHDVEGSPYLTAEFRPAKINDNKKVELIRFNIVDHKIEMHLEEEKILSLDLTKDYQITMLDGSNKIYEIHSCLDTKNNPERIPLQVAVAKDSYVLYLQQRKKLLPKKKTSTYQEEEPAKIIEISDLYYISDFKSESSTLLQIPKRKKKFNSFFGEHTKIVEKYIKQEKLDYSIMGDLIKILDFYFANQKP